MALLEVAELKTHFFTEAGVVPAVDGASFEIDRGEVLCLVGESGSGKSVASLSIMGLVPDPPGRIVGGQIRYYPRKGDPIELTTAPEATLRSLRGNRLAMVFQDPMTSLNPYLRVGTQLAEVLELHQHQRGRAAERAMVAALGKVGIAAPAERLRDYPHQLSGGMRQRVLIAMALLCEPDLLIADEPTTALDVTVQAQILRLVARERARHELGILWITHDLGVVARIADRVAVMYAGRIVEQGTAARVFAQPQHPYTVALARAVPDIERPVTRRLEALEGQPPELVGTMKGCPFRPRCPLAVAVCAEQYPAERRARDDDSHRVHCHVEGS
jgi:oligopeptide/dipeptide ABC transporter ATP-binding protein